MQCEGCNVDIVKTGKAGPKPRFCETCRKERSRETTRRYRARHRDDPEYRQRQADNMNRWRSANPDQWKKLAKASYDRHAEKKRAASRNWREREGNLERERERRRKWRAAHPDVARRGSATYKARKRGATEWEPISRKDVYERDGGKCHICGKRVSFDKMHLDHLIPLSVGGPHVYTNLRVAHAFCNRSRGAGAIPAQLLLV